MELYEHQKQFLADNPHQALLAWEVGTGKSLAAMEWMKKRPNVYFGIIVPKNIKQKWVKDLTKNNIDPLKVTVMTKEEFKKMNPSFMTFTGLIVDEADFFSAPLFTKGRSQLAESLYNAIKKNNIGYVLLLTATPYRNAPHNIHTLLTYIWKAMPWKQWREMTYDLVSRPYVTGMFFEPKKNWRRTAIDYAKPMIYTAKMSDVATVPTQHEEPIKIKTEKLKETEILSETLTGKWHEKARRESDVEKLKWIEDYIADKSKVVFVSRYKETIKVYANKLAKTRKVYILTGEVKDQEKVIADTEADPECVLFIQADIGAGFEIPSFSYMVFINLPFAHRSYIQMKGRICRINRLKENWYTHLVGGPKDYSVYKAITEAESDFNLDTSVENEIDEEPPF